MLSCHERVLGSPRMAVITGATIVAIFAPAMSSMLSARFLSVECSHHALWLLPTKVCVRAFLKKWFAFSHFSPMSILASHIATVFWFPVSFLIAFGAIEFDLVCQLLLSYSILTCALTSHRLWNQSDHVSTPPRGMILCFLALARPSDS